MAGYLRLAIVPVPVSDQDKAQYFYTKLVGLRLITDVAMGPGMRWVVLGSAGGGPQITLVSWHDSMPPGSLRGLTFETDQLIDEHARLKAAGIHVEPIKSEAWGRYANFWDWDGNGLVLAERTNTAKA
jgi:catechol 2,3-dioxygenase-like lactoylglutathione lyase family enzyme